MKAIIPLGKPGMVFADSGIESLREQIGTVLPLKADDEIVGEAKIVDVLVRDDGLALEIETSGEFVDGLATTLEGPLAAMLTLRSMPPRKHTDSLLHPQAVLSDRKRLEEMLTRAGVAFETSEEPEECRVAWERVKYGVNDRMIEAASTLTVKTNQHLEDLPEREPPLTRIGGYKGFFAVIGFNSDGTIVYWENWE